MSEGTNAERITANNNIISANNSDIDAIKLRINNLPDTSVATATAGDIASGKTAFVNGQMVTGSYTPPQVSLQSKDVSISTNGTTTITPDQGYDGLSDVDVTVSGILDTSDANATAAMLPLNKTAYAKGNKITGTANHYTPSAMYGAELANFTDNGDTYYSKIFFGNNSYCEYGRSVAPYVRKTSLAPVIGATANKIKKDEVICGVTGTYEGTNTPDWTQIGYSGVPQEVTNGFNHAQSIMQNWTVKSDYSHEFEDDIDLVFMPLVDTSSATNMREMFNGCFSLMTVPLLDTSNVTNMEAMFVDCVALSTIPQLDTSSVTNMSRMFANCDALQSIPVLNYEEVTDTSSMFVGCTSLTTIPDEDLDAYNLTNTSGMFSGCGSLEIIPESFDVPESQNCSNMFANCTSLTTVPMFGLEGVNSMSNMFYNCPLLSEDSLDNILGMLAYATGGGYSGTKTLKWIGLSQSQANICETLYHWSDCQNRGWTTGY